MPIDWMPLEDLRTGAIFEAVTAHGAVLAVKSEYRYPDGAPECVLLASGEYAHFAARGATLVREVSLAAERERCALIAESHPDRQPAAVSAARAIAAAIRSLG